MNILSICCRSWWWCLIIVIIRDAQNDREAGMVRIIRPWSENMWRFYSTSRRMKTLPTSFIIEMLWRSRDETLSIPLDYGTDFLRFGWGGGTTPSALNNNIKLAIKKTRKAKISSNCAPWKSSTTASEVWVVVKCYSVTATLYTG